MRHAFCVTVSLIDRTHPYRSTLVQGLLPRDAERRYTWCNFVMNNLEDHPTFLEDIVWTDEACFLRNGMFNRQNVHTWSLENPRYAVEVRHQLRWSINVWCGIFNDRLIGPIFYEGMLKVLLASAGCNKRLC
ncbi:hypothetical protein AVEN_109494-1 [Araneus ventricosus]|uniref:Uncharacterized protein n=1 Tax=Araneus ventricosus TaxID=182803 RepID=A0A4Y2W5U9_ARAVE|nr:hypothetical protein AVEN_99345-1 [Araneus ventricosus]GBO32687.1 hypothetical protein AVEN_17696-1 [Araneus ventricosus]GBO32689.1 hypothetical protein AVEN_29402-1 [Araneus ventricosus]GBO32691.1 hypothetical protein AVEN_109494-1 [Araneus ventricosus]